LDGEGWQRVVLAGRGFKGGDLKGKLGAALAASRGLRQAYRLVGGYRPDVFFGVGGYASGPVGLAAWLRRRPVVIHEQNSRPGLANRALAHLASEVFVGFPAGLKSFPRAKTLLTGNPLRPEIVALVDRKYSYEKGERFVILVMGGSQGARRLNLAALDLATKLAEAGRDFEIVHQTGAADESLALRHYEGLGVPHEAKAFFADPARLYAKAHLAITRAGALTVTELAAAGAPALLVPLPTAADDHQTLNALALAELGGAEVVPEAEIGGLFQRAQSLMSQPEKLKAMAGRGRGLVNERAAYVMAERLLARAKA
jgi:UDP-N-acetylglucosamine--N-acetylmuramyl-(pentapeptide) pyrophosphoryl-undecaprenol N-acetylglucosamine transferase